MAAWVRNNLKTLFCDPQDVKSDPQTVQSPCRGSEREKTSSDSEKGVQDRVMSIGEETPLYTCY